MPNEQQHEVAMQRAVAYMNAAAPLPVGSNAFRNAVAAGSAWRQIAQELRIGRSKRSTNYADIDVAAPQVVVVTEQSLQEPKEEDEADSDFSSFGQDGVETGQDDPGEIETVPVG